MALGRLISACHRVHHPNDFEVLKFGDKIVVVTTPPREIGGVFFIHESQLWKSDFHSSYMVIICELWDYRFRAGKKHRKI